MYCNKATLTETVRSVAFGPVILFHRTPQEDVEDRFVPDLEFKFLESGSDEMITYELHALLYYSHDAVHYFAVVWHNGSWYQLNDDVVTAIATPMDPTICGRVTNAIYCRRVRPDEADSPSIFDFRSARCPLQGEQFRD